MKKTFLRSSAINTDFGLLLIRLAIGFLMAFYGLHKLQHFNEMASSDFWMKDVNLFGLTGKVPLALTIFAELFCSVFLILGLFTRLSLIPLLFCMGFIVVVISKFKIVSTGDNGMELNSAFTYFVIYLALFLMGPGKYSVDHFILNKKA